MPSEEQELFDTLRPACVTEFFCDGRVCGSKCCRDWTITLDEEHYALYRRIPNRRIRRRVLEALKRRGDGAYDMKHRKDDACALLELDGLCFLQKNMGEGYLSQTCALYPRVTYLLDGAASGTLTLTCPLAQHLLLLGKEQMRIERVQAPLMRNAFWNVEPKMGGGAFRVVQETVLALLQQRLRTLDERLALAGFFLDCVDEALGKGAEEKELADIAAFYRAPTAAELLAYVPFDGDAHIRWIFGWMDEIKRQGWDSIFWGRRAGKEEFSFNHVTEVYALHAENRLSHLRSLYEEYRTLYRERFLPAHGHILENYLVNEVFVAGFPCKYEGSLAVEWRLFVARWKLLEFFLIAWVKRCDGDIGEDVLLSLIECAELSAMHFPRYMEAWSAYIQAGEQELLPWMRQMLVCGER